MRNNNWKQRVISTNLLFLSKLYLDQINFLHFDCSFKTFKTFFFKTFNSKKQYSQQSVET